jgi:hypothetical protein
VIERAALAGSVLWLRDDVFDVSSYDNLFFDEQDIDTSIDSHLIADGQDISTFFHDDLIVEEQDLNFYLDDNVLLVNSLCSDSTEPSSKLRVRNAMCPSPSAPTIPTIPDLDDIENAVYDLTTAPTTPTLPDLDDIGNTNNDPTDDENEEKNEDPPIEILVVGEEDSRPSPPFQWVEWDTGWFGEKRAIREDEPEYYCNVFAASPWDIPVCASENPADVRQGFLGTREVVNLLNSELRQLT